jgi:hypothetical protein
MNKEDAIPFEVVKRDAPETPEEELKRLQAEILSFPRRTLENSRRIGEILTIKQNQVEPGDWLIWLHEEDIGVRMAQRYQQLYENWDRLVATGKLDQITSLNKALKLLISSDALAKDERTDDERELDQLLKKDRKKKEAKEKEQTEAALKEKRLREAKESAEAEAGRIEREAWEAYQKTKTQNMDPASYIADVPGGPMEIAIQECREFIEERLERIDDDDKVDFMTWMRALDDELLDMHAKDRAGINCATGLPRTS